ncbi:Spx/MgsR family RNA polymerase-binding regulatory protein [Sneathiella litorea]|uniref:Spx/MgsR family RNA polymerase-binding regulatory protein n=1 Tax=Sneathiella litorea TaxID=2606216 RepID=A0A6L8W8M9_9PROT|nr:Spx/MgsR family RNA polymerase-binding regulatory protein [Sneathiella litorea]MZR30822.1 Spx/MgsR family RNA polymerase-binding regulatory protein [Sneathiella litorea]
MYGIKNCDTCRKALKWLKEEGIDCDFHDLRADGLPAAELTKWLAAIDRNILINKRGTTYRQLDSAAKAVLEEDDPAAIILTLPTLLKRPIFSHNDRYLVGFKEPEKETLKEWAA